jgi:hypothetical protein
VAEQEAAYGLFDPALRGEFADRGFGAEFAERAIDGDAPLEELDDPRVDVGGTRHLGSVAEVVGDLGDDAGDRAAAGVG